MELNHFEFFIKNFSSWDLSVGTWAHVFTAKVEQAILRDAIRHLHTQIKACSVLLFIIVFSISQLQFS
jgi:hypothetical protein